jgi:UDP-GlcNAc:undecaprenyl-phosphate GlcNAc-1-phosphate transferase
VFALSYPLLDTGVAMLRRWLRGVSLSRADRRHIHHQLQALGLGPTRSIAVIYSGSLFIAALGVFAAIAPPAVTVFAMTTGALILFLIFGYGLQLLEYHEFHAAGSFFASGLSRARLVIQDTINARDVAAVVRLADTYAELEAILEDSASNFRFAHMELRSSAVPPTHLSSGKYRKGPFWKLEYPIAPETNSPGRPAVFLTIWCSSEEPQRPSGAERVVHVLVPAILDCLERVSGIPHLPAEAAARSGAHGIFLRKTDKEQSSTIPARSISVRR